MNFTKLICCAGFIALSGCAITPRDRVDFYQDTYSELSPVARPQRIVTSFSDSLYCMDSLLREAHLPVTLVATKAIPDSSGLVSVSSKDMVITALSKMSHTSNAFRVVDYEVDPLKQDTVQNLTSLLLNAGQINIFKPAIYVSGGVSALEKNTRGKRRSFGVSGRDAEFGLTRELLASVIGLELHMGDFGSRTLIPGVYSSNEISTGLAGSGFSGGGRAVAKINGTTYTAGLQYEASDDVTMGLGIATRTLIELGMIELVGRWARVPYWQCLAVEQSHPEIQRELASWYRDMSTSQRVAEMQNGLATLGYYKGEKTGTFSPELARALRTFQGDRRLVPTGTVTFETYDSLVRQYVVVEGNNTFKRIGWSEVATKPNNIDPKMAAEPIFITLPKADLEYTVGESIYFNVVSDRTRYLYCYYQDSKGGITRIYPSVFQPRPVVEGGRSLLIPNIFDPNTFSLVMGAPGKQSVLCLGDDDDMLAKVTAELPEPALSPMRATDLGQIQQVFDKAVGSSVVKGQVSWTVAPNPTPAAPVPAPARRAR
jgi:peptidoglycan hydrolase-like protein with peptidoglycan-binding domain